MTETMTTKRRWGGQGGYTLCSSCGKTFTGTQAFDDHRVGRYEPLERRCLTTHEMTLLGAAPNEWGDWPDLPPQRVWAHCGVSVDGS